jgi:hypothetical protein
MMAPLPALMTLPVLWIDYRLAMEIEALLPI